MTQRLTREQVIEKYELDKNLSGLDLDRLDLSGLNLSEAMLWKTNLNATNLTGTNLRGANLFGTILTYIKGKEITTFQGSQHFSYYTDGIITIGNQSKTPDEWINDHQPFMEKHKYSKKEIKIYLMFIKICKEMERNDNE